MKYAELTKKLRSLGCEFTRSKDIGPKLLARILRELKIDKRDFDRA